MADVKAFWEHKILGWERGRYDQQGGEPGLLQRIADRSSRSLRFRIVSAGEVVAPYVAGKRVVDLGCGSGLLAGAVLAAGATSYVGYDIAEAAIERARQRAADEGWGDRVRFERASTGDLSSLDADLVISLGLTDWLTDAELDHLFAISGKAEFLHAISELKQTPAQWLHRAYCWTSYGFRNGGYVPRYFRTEAFAAFARPHREGPVYVWRDPRLSFGAYLTSLPVGPRVGG